MFAELKAEVVKVESAVKSAFGDTKAGVAGQKTALQTIDSEAKRAFDGVEAEAKKAEATVRAKIREVRSALERLVT